MDSNRGKQAKASRLLSNHLRAISSAAAIGIIIAVAIIAATGVVVIINNGSSSTTSTGTTAVSSSSTSSGGQAIQVSIYSGARNPSNPPGFAPDNITIVIGVNSTVMWTNHDTAPHTVTSTSAPSGGSFDSGNLDSGATYTHTFTVPGVYHYACSYHYWMTGTIVVKATS